jgi:hypothetical protein
MVNVVRSLALGTASASAAARRRLDHVPSGPRITPHAGGALVLDVEVLCAEDLDDDRDEQPHRRRRGPQRETDELTDGQHEAVDAAVAMVEVMRTQSAQLQTMVDGYADISHATAELLCSRARQIAAPPPVSSQLRGFGTMLAAKATATMSMLTKEQGQRLAVLVPSFTRAALANDPDVVATVMMWLDLEPCELARVLVASLPDLERRFAS